MSLGVSVVICCHNSAQRLPKTLGYLAAQKVPPHISWEILVIDNASNDNTAKIAMEHSPPKTLCPLRLVYEPLAGLRHARIRAVNEANYEVISFLDDDNFAPNDWVARVSEIFGDNARIGASGGRAEPLFEIPPPDWFQAIKGFYALGSQHASTGDITNAPGTLLYGAGLSLRTTAVRELLANGFSFLMSGRQGNSLLSGEDTELCFALRELGWRLWYDDTLILRHYIPKERLVRPYAERLLYGMGQASVFLDLYLMALSRPPFDRYSAYKKTWVFQIMKAWRQHLLTILINLKGSLSRRENFLFAPRVLLNRGRLAMLWSTRKRYQELLRLVAQSSWAKLGKK